MLLFERSNIFSEFKLTKTYLVKLASFDKLLNKFLSKVINLFLESFNSSNLFKNTNAFSFRPIKLLAERFNCFSFGRSL